MQMGGTAIGNIPQTIRTQFQADLEAEIISATRDLQLGGLKTMWDGEIAWLRSAQFAQIWDDRAQTIWEV